MRGGGVLPESGGDPGGQGGAQQRLGEGREVEVS